MPVYEYECKSCKKTVEHMQRFDDPPLEYCQSCGGELKKLISNTSFVLKGNGWYITDYARKPKADSEDKADKKDVSSDKTTSESKDAPQAEKKSSEVSNKAESVASSDATVGASKNE